MPRVPEGHVRFYEDGPWWPCTPLQQAAEQEYRRAFMSAAREAAGWNEIDVVAIEEAWNERRRTREESRMLLPSDAMFENASHVVYRPGHEIEAARTRGRVHGFEFVRQCWEELVKAGVDQQIVGREIIAPWLSHVDEWLELDIDPECICPPPHPHECLTERQRRMLEQAKRAISTSDPAKPHAILTSLVGVTREILEWLWPGRVPLGKRTLLAGDPGLGKSFVTLDIAARVSRGEAWPDTPLLKQPAGDVVLLNAEDDLADTIAPRLDKMEANDARIPALEGVESFGTHFSLEADLPRLEEVLVANEETRLVVIDPIAAYCGAVDSHKNSDVRGLLAPLAGRHRVAIVSVTHLSKSGGSKAVYRAMGSLAFAAAARAVWAVTKDPDDPTRRLLLPAKLNLARDPDGLAYRIDDGRVAWEPEPIQLHADDAFAAEARAATATGNRGGERREASAWLQKELADGPVPTSQIIADARSTALPSAHCAARLRRWEAGRRKGAMGNGPGTCQTNMATPVMAELASWQASRWPPN